MLDPFRHHAFHVSSSSRAQIFKRLHDAGFKQPHIFSAYDMVKFQNADWVVGGIYDLGGSSQIHLRDRIVMHLVSADTGEAMRGTAHVGDVLPSDRTSPVSDAAIHAVTNFWARTDLPMPLFEDRSESPTGHGPSLTPLADPPVLPKRTSHPPPRFTFENMGSQHEVRKGKSPSAVSVDDTTTTTTATQASPSVAGTSQSGGGRGHGRGRGKGRGAGRGRGEGRAASKGRGRGNGRGRGIARGRTKSRSKPSHSPPPTAAPSAAATTTTAAAISPTVAAQIFHPGDGSRATVELGVGAAMRGPDPGLVAAFLETGALAVGATTATNAQLVRDFLASAMTVISQSGPVP